MRLPESKDGFYAQGRLFSLRVLARDSGTIYLRLGLEITDGPDEGPGSEEGGEHLLINLLCLVPKTSDGMEIYRNLRDPSDPSDGSCSKGAFLRVHFHLVPLPGMVLNPDLLPPEQTPVADSICFMQAPDLRRARNGRTGQVNPS